MTNSLPSVTIVRRINAPAREGLRGDHTAQTNDAVVGS
jgi:hypothetical protein